MESKIPKFAAQRSKPIPAASGPNLFDFNSIKRNPDANKPLAGKKIFFLKTKCFMF